MMKYRPISFILALALLAGAGCSHLDRPVGTVTLTFSTGETRTKASTPGDGNVADGGGIAGTAEQPDLRIFIIQGGTVKARYIGPESSEEPSSTNFSDTDQSATEISVQFKLETGSYSVLAVANLGATSGNLSIEGAPDWSHITSAAELQEALFSELSGNDSPLPGDRMPLSATGTLTVNSDENGLTRLELLRCVAKVDLTFRNLLDEELDLEDCEAVLHDMNPSRGYLFAMDPDLAGDYRDLTLTARTTIHLGKVSGTENTALICDPATVFPGVARLQAVPTSGYRYLCDISFRVGETDYTFTNLPVHDIRSDIQALKRNQYLRIETTIGRRSEDYDISFSFEVNDWETHRETVIFH